MDNILPLKVFQGAMLVCLIAGLYVIFGASNLTSTFFTIEDNLSAILIEKTIKFMFKI